MKEKVLLKDIAGYEIEKAEALKIINVLKNYDEFAKEGIGLPKGILLFGDPGVGKTMFAEAIANEANVNLITFTNTDDNLVDNIKTIFAKARESRPSIILFDEIGCVMHNDHFAMSRSSDIEKKALQTLLTEIDGLNDSNGILFIATTNDKYEIPQSLLRSGRLEKHIYLSRPSVDAREKIFDLYLSKYPNLKSISRRKLAKKTNRFSCADIKLLVNETLLEAKTFNNNITIDNFERLIPSVFLKELKNKNDKKNLDIIAYHELGHFICIYDLKNEISSLSIERYSNVCGLTQNESETNEKTLIKKSNYMNELTILLGGLAGEEVLFGDTSISTSSDLENAFGIISSVFDSGLLGFKYVRMSSPYRGYEPSSSNQMAMIEEKRAEILEEALAKAKEIITRNKPIALALIEELKNNERLSSEKIYEILKSKKLLKKEVEA